MTPSPSPNQGHEFDRLAYKFTEALFELDDLDASSHESVAKRISSILLSEESTGILVGALVTAILGYASCFHDLIGPLIRALKNILEREQIRNLEIQCSLSTSSDTGRHNPTFKSVFEDIFGREIQSTYDFQPDHDRKLRAKDGSLDWMAACSSMAFLSAAAIKEGLTCIVKMDSHREVALQVLQAASNRDGVQTKHGDTTKGTLDLEVYAIAMLISFALVGAREYASIIGEGNELGADGVKEDMRKLEKSGIVEHPRGLLLLEASS